MCARTAGNRELTSMATASCRIIIVIFFVKIMILSTLTKKLKDT